MNKDKTYDKDIIAKRLVFTVAVALIAVVISAVAAHYTNGNLTDALPDTTADSEIVTQLAEVPKTNVPDERTTAYYEDETEQNEDETENATTIAVLETQPHTQTEPPQTAAVNAEFVLPFDGDIIKNYSKSQVQYSETMSDWRIHLGADFSGNEGDEVCSVGNGTVSNVYADSKWGYVIEIDYGTFTGRYCGISQEGAVGINQELRAGDVIGKLTSIPIESADGVHLHFEALKNGVNVDPFEALGK